MGENSSAATGVNHYRPSQNIYGCLLFLLLVIYPFASLTYFIIFYIAALASLFVVIIYQLSLGTIPLQILKDKKIYYFFLLIFVSSIWAHYPERTIYVSSISLVFLWVFILAQLTYVECHDRWWRLTTIMLPIIYLLLFIFIYIRYGSIRTLTYEMKGSLGSFSNIGPSAVEICVPFLVYGIIYTKNKYFLVFSLISAIIVILISQSRGAYLLLIISIVLMSIFFGKNIGGKLRNFILVTIFACLTGVLTMSIVNHNSITIRFIDWIQNQDNSSQLSIEEPVKGETGYVRAVMYYEGMKVIMENPILGIGFGGLKEYINDRYGFPVVSHNLIITGWGELGILGFILFIAVFIKATLKLLRKKSEYKFDIKARHYYYAMAIALIVAVLHGMVRPQLDNPLLYVLLAYVLTNKSSLRVSRQIT